MNTTRTIRTDRQWVQITRNADIKTWTIARGWAGEFKAHDITHWPFKFAPTWVEAENVARLRLTEPA